MSYDTLDAFIGDLPALAAPVKDKLVGHDGLFKIECGDRTEFLELTDGVLTVSATSDHDPLCVIKADEKQLMEIINGRVSPMKALLFGKVSIRGDVKPLLKLCSLL